MLPIKTNIYGDYKVCIKCKDPADVVEKTKNYCVKCWFEHVEGKSFNEVNQRLKDKESWCWRINEILNNIYIPIRLLFKRLRF
jgi:hypothetical protein